MKLLTGGLVGAMITGAAFLGYNHFTSPEYVIAKQESSQRSELRKRYGMLNVTKTGSKETYTLDDGTKMSLAKHSYNPWCRLHLTVNDEITFISGKVHYSDRPDSDAGFLDRILLKDDEGNWILYNNTRDDAKWQKNYEESFGRLIDHRDSLIEKLDKKFNSTSQDTP